MSPSPDRLARVNRLIQETLADLLISEVKDPQIQEIPIVSVVQVKTTPDLRFAKVYLSIVAEQSQQQRALQRLQKARRFLRAELGRRVRLRYTPELVFTLDERITAAAKIDKILRELSGEKKEEEA